MIVAWSGLALASGCSSSVAEVTGTVTFKDKPLPGGIITFFAEGGLAKPASAMIDESGNYRVKAPIGKCVVTVDNRVLSPERGEPIGAGGAAPKVDPSIAPRGKTGGPMVPPADVMKKARDEKNAPPPSLGERPNGTYVEIPKKYYTSEATDLSFEVKKGAKNTYNFELK
jgi:hypothetical protein